MPLQLVLPELETFDDRTMTFSQYPSVVLQLEHSLLSISKWEMKYQKPFLTNDEKTREEFLYYIQCMTINKVVPDVYNRITDREFGVVDDYIHNPMTATTFQSIDQTKPQKETITSELVYYWMCAAQIPWEAEKWHFNRLMALIRIHSVKNDNSKMTGKETRQYQQSLNQARRAKHAKHTKHK